MFDLKWKQFSCGFQKWRHQMQYGKSRIIDQNVQFLGLFVKNELFLIFELNFKFFISTYRVIMYKTCYI